MIIDGWCIKCRKVKRVRATQLPIGRIAIGVCLSCEDRKR